ncbi:hypothetical protein F0249_10435 [Vibrio sp. 03-59-1]|uniref:hypothetical protein n=1 Tax=Vibrio sp. 03-59-1 TaxID=2607607 RepID=UPI001493CFD9|nr:hypothetical protein [Vibrio sp. 03-59-1]NOH84231.1 hypothetical protein [Vibrio sp. 03-59-1]
MKKIKLGIWLAITSGGLVGCQSTIMETLEEHNILVINKDASLFGPGSGPSVKQIDTHGKLAGYPYLLEKHPDIGKIPYAYKHKPHVIKMTEVYLGMPREELGKIAKIHPLQRKMEYVANIIPPRDRVDKQFYGFEKPIAPAGRNSINNCPHVKGEYKDYNSVLGYSSCGEFPLRGISTKSIPALRYAQDIKNATGYGLYKAQYDEVYNGFSFAKGYAFKPEELYYSYRVTTDMHDRVVAFSVTKRFPFKAGFFEEKEAGLKEQAKLLNVPFKEFSEGFNVSGLRSIAYTVGADQGYMLMRNPWGYAVKYATIPLYMVSTIEDDIKYGILSSKTRAPYEITLSCDLDNKDYCYVNYQQNAIFSSYQASAEILTSKNKAKINEKVLEYVNK